MKHKKLAVVVTLVLAMAMLTVSAFAAPSPSALTGTDANGATVEIQVTDLETTSDAYLALASLSGYQLASGATVMTLDPGDAATPVSVSLSAGAGTALAQYVDGAWTVIAQADENGIITIDLKAAGTYAIVTPVVASTGDTTTDAANATGTDTTSPRTGETVSTTAITLAVVFVGLAGLFTVVAYKRRTV